jgi:myo-inositol-1(or 4)-monophosphatase
MSSQILTNLVNIAHEAGSVIYQICDKENPENQKYNPEKTLLCENAVHTLVKKRFTELFPDLPKLMEEDDNHTIYSGAFLVADELDGTLPFEAGSQDWGIMLALIDGAPMYGVIHLPAKGITIWAEKGKGCWMNGNRIILETPLGLNDAILGTEINSFFTSEHWESVRGTVQKVKAVRCLACTAASTFELLNGITQVYVNAHGGNIWDFAAPAIAIQESGGMVAAMHGTSLRWDKIAMNFMAASNAALMNELNK